MAEKKEEVKEKPIEKVIDDGKKEYTVIKQFKLGTKKPKTYKVNDKIRLTKQAYSEKKREGKVK